MTYYTRSQWGARAPRARYHFGGSDVAGIALHWPAMRTRKTTVAAVMRALRSWQRYHMDGHGWSDIAYQEAIDQDGNVYDLRGLGHQSGANGDSTLNRRYGAILLVLAPGEQPSDAMMRAARNRIARHRSMHRTSHRIVGHGQIREGGTQCPGPITQHLIHRGAFEPQPKPDPREDDDMPYTDWPKKDREALVRDIVNAIVSTRLKQWDGPGDDDASDEMPLGQMLGQARGWARTAALRSKG